MIVTQITIWSHVCDSRWAIRRVAEQLPFHRSWFCRIWHLLNGMVVDVVPKLGTLPILYREILKRRWPTGLSTSGGFFVVSMDLSTGDGICRIPLTM